jgi:hypothetical protein
MLDKFFSLKVISWATRKGFFGFVALFLLAGITLASGSGIALAIGASVSNTSAQVDGQVTKIKKTLPTSKSSPKPSQASDPDQTLDSELEKRLGHELFSQEEWLQDSPSGVFVDFRSNGVQVNVLMVCLTQSGGARISDGNQLNVQIGCQSSNGSLLTSTSHTGFYPFSCVGPTPQTLSVSLWGTKLDGNYTYPIPSGSLPNCGVPSTSVEITPAPPMPPPPPPVTENQSIPPIEQQPIQSPDASSVQ